MKPYMCPICSGRGFVPAGFYSLGTLVTDTPQEICHACLGTGILWERKDD